MKRRWLLVDIDPCRPSGIPSTEEEHQAALDRSDEIRDFLCELGWPLPVYIDSGNGAYLLYRIDLPNDDASRDLVRDVLRTLAAQFSDERVDVDQAVYNAARLMRLPGTMNRKGDGSPDRPHRPVRLLKAPEKVELVPRDFLERLAALNREEQAAPEGRASECLDDAAVQLWIERHGLQIHQSKAWQSGQLYILEECPFASGHRRTARIIQHASGAWSFGCFHNSCHDHDWAALKRKLGDDGPLGAGCPIPNAPVVLDDGAALKPSSPYVLNRGGLAYEKSRGDEVQVIQLANFVACISREVILDDGMNQNLEFEIFGRLGDAGRLPTITISASSFAGMGWVTRHWGARTIIEAGPALKDRLRVAIQQINPVPTRQLIYVHTGWRQHKRQWVFVHAGGAIGPDGPMSGVEVQLPGKRVQDYRLPQNLDEADLPGAVEQSLRQWEITPLEVAVPLLAAVYRAPLGEALPVDLSLFVVGRTGVQKSALTAVALGHYGSAFDGDNLPGSWSSTDNALEEQAFALKDALFPIDDFIPTGTSADLARYHKRADRVLRAQGNRSGRARMTASGALRGDRPPRGLIISTGEDYPQGQSLRARMLCLEIKKGDVDLAQLTEAQDLAAQGVFACAMAGYVQFLAPRMEALKEVLPKIHRQLRAEVRRTGLVSHDRLPDLVASLAIGWWMMLEYAAIIGAIDAEDRRDMWQQGWRALVRAGHRHFSNLQDQDPAEHFVALLGAAITSGKAHLQDAGSGGAPEDPGEWGWQVPEGGPPLARGECVGWICAGTGANNGQREAMLNPDAVLAVARDLARRQDQPLTLSKKTLLKHLAEAGLLEAIDAGQHTVNRRVMGRQRRVIVLSAEIVQGGVSSPTVASVTQEDIEVLEMPNLNEAITALASES